MKEMAAILRTQVVKVKSQIKGSKSKNVDGDLDKVLHSLHPSSQCRMRHHEHVKIVHNIRYTPANKVACRYSRYAMSLDNLSLTLMIFWSVC